MNKLITNISAFIIVFLISSCNILELYERPMYRIQNYCDYVADFTIITESTDTVHYNNIQNNTSGDFVNTIEGKLYVSVSVHGKSEQYADSTIVVHNRKYTITLHDGEVFGYHNIHLAITYEKYY